MHVILSSSHPQETHLMCMFSLFYMGWLKMGGSIERVAYFRFLFDKGGLDREGA